MNCPECHSPVETGGDGPVVCDACGLAFEPGDEAGRLRRKKELVDISLLQIHRDAEGLEVKTPWQTSRFMLFFSFFWCLSSALFLLSTFSMSQEAQPSDPQGGSIAILICLAFPPIGVATAYIALAFWLNKTAVSVRGRMVSVSCAPVPWFGVDQSFDRADIRRLFVAKYASHGEKKGGKRSVVYKYKVVAMGYDGSTAVLLDGVDTYARAVSIEAVLEEELGMQDEVVPGEQME